MLDLALARSDVDFGDFERVREPPQLFHARLQMLG